METVEVPKVDKTKEITEENLETLVTDSAVMFSTIKTYYSDDKEVLKAELINEALKDSYKVYQSVLMMLNSVIDGIPESIEIIRTHPYNAAREVLLQASLTYANGKENDIKVVRDLYRMIPNLLVVIEGLKSERKVINKHSEFYTSWYKEKK